MGSIVYSVEPTIPPVTLEDVKAHLRVDHSDQDSLILGYIFSATKYAQEYTWSQLITATFVQRWDRFQQVLLLDRNPAVSVATVQYVDTGGVMQTLTATTDYVVDVNIKPARIVPAYTKWWPPTRCHINDVVVTFDAGYGASEQFTPVEMKQAIMLLVEEMYNSCDDAGLKNKRARALMDLRSYRTFY